ncbi:mandelate racemase/muconate lactonizing enzyme family protein [Bacteroidota bacterium]
MISRRTFINTAGLTAAGLITKPTQILKAKPNAVTEIGKVKITDVKTAAIKIKKYKTHLIKIETDSGFFGLGEAYPKAEIADDIQDVKRKIIGKDPLFVETLHQHLTEEFISRGSRTGSLCGAISGIEIALWDLAGKILNVPVYVLLGGKYRDKLLIYHDADSPKGYDSNAWVDSIQKSVDHGFKAIKLSLPRYDGEEWNRTIPTANLNKWVKILEAVRSSLDPEIKIAVDLHWKYNTRDSLKFTRMMEHLDIWFLEDPMPPENADAFARLTSQSKTPIATGENLFSREGFRPFIEKQACDFIHPDAQKCGGLLEMKKIADWADLYYMNMLCHNGCSPVGTTASGHACMAIKSFIALESDGVTIPYWQDIIKREGPFYKNGYLEVPNKPGIGVELNEDVCKAHLADDRGFFE